MKKTIQNAVRVLFILVGILFVICGIFYSAFSNFSPANFFPILLGTLTIIAGAWSAKIVKNTPHGWARGVRILCTTFLLLFSIGFICLGAVIFLHAQHTPKEKKDAAIILGAGLRGDRVTTTLALRLNKAAEYLRENKNTIAVVSGGQGSDEWVTEASAMKKYLIHKGVQPKRILEEGRSTSTKENFMFSKELLDARLGVGRYRCVYVTNSFHAYRASLYAKKAGLDAESLASRSPAYTLPNHYTREYLALLWYALFER